MVTKSDMSYNPIRTLAAISNRELAKHSQKAISHRIQKSQNLIRPWTDFPSIPTQNSRGSQTCSTVILCLCLLYVVSLIRLGTFCFQITVYHVEVETNTNLATFPRNFAYSAQITLHSVRPSAEHVVLLLSPPSLSAENLTQLGRSAVRFQFSAFL